MSKVRVVGSSVSLDDFSAGVEQSLSDPLGKGGPEMFQWFFHTQTFCSMVGRGDGRGTVRFANTCSSGAVSMSVAPLCGRYADRPA
jgi:hypothetical protein